MARNRSSDGEGDGEIARASGFEIRGDSIEASRSLIWIHQCFRDVPWLGVFQRSVEAVHDGLFLTRLGGQTRPRDDALAISLLIDLIADFRKCRWCMEMVCS